MPIVQQKHVSRVMKRFATVIAEAICSPCVKVGQAAISALTDSSIGLLVSENSRTIFPIVYPALCRANKEHWCLEMRQSAGLTLSHLVRVDSRMFTELATPDPVGKNKIDNPLRKNWASIVTLAMQNDKSVNMGLKIGEISKLFAAPRANNPNDFVFMRRASAVPNRGLKPLAPRLDMRSPLPGDAPARTRPSVVTFE